MTDFDLTVLCANFKQLNVTLDSFYKFVDLHCVVYILNFEA